MDKTVKTYKVPLTYSELLSLDGKVSSDAQSVIDTAKREAELGFDFPLINEIILKSEQSGKLTWRYKEIRACSFCDKDYSYHPHQRNSRYHRKGRPNHNRPIYYTGLKFHEGFISLQGSGDLCSDCERKFHVIESAVNYIVDHDLKIEIQKNDYKPTRYIKDDVVICFKCKEEVQRSKLGLLPAMIKGYYPGQVSELRRGG